MLAVVAVMLGSVGFDGFSRSSAWQDLRARVEGPYVLDSPGVADLLGTLLALAGLVACIALVAGAYLAAIRIAELVTRSDRSLAAEFVRSLVPIALVYAVAHYFTLLVVYSQVAVSLASDPFGSGWDLFGTADFAPESGAALAERRLVRPGRRARRGPRRRARGRPRPSDYASSRHARRCGRSTRCSS